MSNTELEVRLKEKTDILARMLSNPDCTCIDLKYAPGDCPSCQLFDGDISGVSVNVCPPDSCKDADLH